MVRISGARELVSGAGIAALLPIIFCLFSVSACSLEETLSSTTDVNGKVVVYVFDDWVGAGGERVDNPTAELVRSGQLRREIGKIYRDQGKPMPDYEFVVRGVSGGGPGTPQHPQAEQDYQRLMDGNVRHVIGLGVDGRRSTQDGFRMESMAVNRRFGVNPATGQYDTGTVTANLPPDAAVFNDTTVSDQQRTSEDIGRINDDLARQNAGTQVVPGGNGTGGAFDCNQKYLQSMIDRTNDPEAPGYDPNRDYKTDFIHVPGADFPSKEEDCKGRRDMVMQMSQPTATMIFNRVEGQSATTPPEIQSASDTPVPEDPA